MKVSDFDHAIHVCNWHETQPQNEHIGGDRVWARRWLSGQVRDHILTGEEANDVRRSCGWDVEPEQLPLFEAAP